MRAPPVFTHRRFLSCYFHQRSAIRAITSRTNTRYISTDSKRNNSSLAIETPPNSEITKAALLHSRHKNLPSFKSHDRSPINGYQRLVEGGTLKPDAHQTRIVQKLERLHNDLSNHDPPPVPSLPTTSSLVARLFSRAPAQPTSLSPDQLPQGLYLYGDVGTGKTMLMDLFYNNLHPHIKRKRRVHFHAFMIDVHKRIHATKLKLGSRGGDPIEPVARDLANEAYVLCFDEFQVTDIADAMILRQLFERLLNYGVVCVITSNRHPDELYKNGIQRSSFVPCIELLKERFEVTDLDSGTDYRRLPRTLSHVYYDPLTPENRAEVDKIFKAFTSDPSDPLIHNRTLETWGRKLVVPESTTNVAKFSFHELCGKPLSAADYLEITKTFGTIFVVEVPKMGLGEKDMARRFITFVDACYESKTKIFVSSEVPIYKIFADDANEDKAMSDQMRAVMDDLGLDGSVIGSSGMFSGEEEIFAFARCCSRLVQMGSKEWAETSGLH